MKTINMSLIYSISKDSKTTNNHDKHDNSFDIKTSDMQLIQIHQI